jgi:hypothetical protein
MKTYCPVAGCSYIVKGADDGWEHWQDCDDLHRKLHINWLNFFYPDLAKTVMPDTVKFRIAYRKWNKDKKDKLHSDATRKKEMAKMPDEHAIPKGMDKLLKK